MERFCDSTPRQRIDSEQSDVSEKKLQLHATRRSLHHTRDKLIENINQKPPSECVRKAENKWRDISFGLWV